MSFFVASVLSVASLLISCCFAFRSKEKARRLILLIPAILIASIFAVKIFFCVF